VVTGASGIIGSGFCEASIACGANVAMTYNSNGAPVHERLERRGGAGPKLSAHQLDCTAPEVDATIRTMIEGEVDAIKIIAAPGGLS
jgi:NAD(P)-dependent dehydrogenase (short-subunit alcohol dehydrogenase family)